MNASNAKQPTFESSLTALEKIVRRLEQGDLPLEESLKLFEDGVKLSRECQERLNQAERRIEVLLRDGEGNPALQEVKKENLSGGSATTAAESAPEPKIKRRIVFEENDDEDDTPF